MGTEAVNQSLSPSNATGNKAVVRAIDATAEKLIIKVVAIGGGGGHILDETRDILDGSGNFNRAQVEYWAFNTDWEDLRALDESINVFQFGKETTKGRGAGEDVKVGQAAAEEDMDSIQKYLKDADWVIFLVCKGKGSGSGGGTAIAKKYAEELIADDTKRRAAIVIATEPFLFEGLSRKTKAEAALELIRETRLPLAVIPNQLLMPTTITGVKVKDMFNEANKRIARMVARTAYVMANRLNMWNADANDIMNVLRQSLENTDIPPDFYFGVGYAKAGEDRMIQALSEAATNPILRTQACGCKKVFMSIHANDVTDRDWVAIQNFMQAQRLDPNAEWLYGISDEFKPMRFEESQDIDVCVTILGLGYIPPTAAQLESAGIAVSATVLEAEAVTLPENVEQPELVMQEVKQIAAPAPVVYEENTRDFTKLSFTKTESKPSTLIPKADSTRGDTPVQTHYKGLAKFGSIWDLVQGKYWGNAKATEILQKDLEALHNHQGDNGFTNNPDIMAETVKFLSNKKAQLSPCFSEFWRGWTIEETITQRRLFDYKGTDGSGNVIFQLEASMSTGEAKVYVKRTLLTGIQDQESEIDVRTIDHLLELGELWKIDVLELLVPPQVEKARPTKSFRFWPRSSARPTLPV